MCRDSRRTATQVSRREVLQAGLMGSVASLGLGAAGSTTAQAELARGWPQGVERPDRRILLQGGAILSLDPQVGDFEAGDVLIEGSKIVQVDRHIQASDVIRIDARGKIVMPGLVDTHHHQFETALRGLLANAILLSDDRPENALNYNDTVLQNISRVYRPQDVYINELFGSLSQLDAGVTTVLDVSQIHHTPEHSDAAIEALRAAGRRAVLGYFEGWGEQVRYPQDVRRLREQYFSSNDQRLTLMMGGEIYLPGYEEAWRLGRELDLPIALHVVGTFGMQETFDRLGAAGEFGPDNLFIHMTGMSDAGWRHAADAGAHVSLAVPIEMHMRHGTPQIQRALDLGMGLSLSTDVECTMTADPFTQMRAFITLQRMFENERALAGQPHARLLTALDTLRIAIQGGAAGLKLETKIGALSPGKEADILLLDAEAINVAPLNNIPGAIVTLMDRSNVDTVFVAGELKKWRGQLLGFDLARLRTTLGESRDYLFAAAGIERDLFADPT